ncbi:MAG: adenylosuccinate synthase [Clostridia bacterium]|nr:adenylosuccinate synthase [Clostridia bacterium]
MLTAIVGTNWGDEGKGRMVDLLCEEMDVVARYQGGNNAGHTVINDRGKFILNLLPSGILHENKVNLMGNGMVIDIEHLCGEIEKLRAAGVSITPDNLKISSGATITMPYDKAMDILEEDRLGDAKYGSTRRGIAPVYGDKYMKKGVRIADLLYSDEELLAELENILSWKNLTIHGGYGAEPYKAGDMLAWLRKFGDPIKPFITNSTVYLTQQHKAGKNIMFEAQLGTLRDIDYGIYPYTTSSTTLAAFAPIGAGVPGLRLDRVVGVMKAYSSCVGAGPFTCELFGEKGDELREAGGEYGAATGRPRRVGGFDVVASRYGAMMQGCTEIALTKLDVLSYLKEIPVCVSYDCYGETEHDFPTGHRLDAAKPNYEYFEGFGADISSCRKKEDLPAAARRYIDYIEREVDCRISYVSVGPAREDIIYM